MQTAVEYHKSGNLKNAEYIYKQILEKNPDNSVVPFLVGVLYSQLCKYDLAIVYLKKAVQLNPLDVAAHYNLGNAFAFMGEKYFAKAVECYNKTLQLNPNHADTYINLGNISAERGNVEDAISYYREAIRIDHENDDAYYNLGNALLTKDLFDEAISCYCRVLQIRPDNFDAFNNLGIAYKEKGQFDNAVNCYQNAIKINPHYASAYFNLGYAFMKIGDFESALVNFQRSLQINPNSSETFKLLGITYSRQGKTNEAESSWKRAIQINPEDPIPYEDLLMGMNYSNRYNKQTILAEHVKFANQFEKPLSSSLKQYTNGRQLSRRLKIGYISPDFRRHAVAYFIEPVLVAHNRDHYEVFCYSNSNKYDEVTKRIQNQADHWRSIVKISDEEVADLIRKDEIDILVDLAGHTANNRILVFARKPAPIQISWIGYLTTTGLSAIDYRIADSYTDPPGETEKYYTEKLIRLPESFLCYLPDIGSPEVGPLPALSKGYITFGSFNNFVKMTPEMFTIWAGILNGNTKNPDLILKGKSFGDKTTCQYTINMFLQRGIAAQRITLQSWDPSPKHLESYNLVDIGLDTFPFNGATTTCEAMWMGVPVINLAGDAYHSRSGESLLSNVGLKKLIAKTYDDYIEIAVNLAADVKRLQRLRNDLRIMMKKSPLTDAKRFTHNLEKSYRNIWETWCNSV